MGGQMVTLVTPVAPARGVEEGDEGDGILTVRRGRGRGEGGQRESRWSQVGIKRCRELSGEGLLAGMGSAQCQHPTSPVGAQRSPAGSTHHYQ